MRESGDAEVAKGDEAATIRFINESATTIIVQWTDYKGRKTYAKLQPGAHLTQQSYLTHPWIAASLEGTCRQLFLPSAGPTVARLLPEAQLPRASR